MARIKGFWCKDEVEEAHALPIHKVARWSKVQPGYWGTVRWSIGDREVSSIGYVVLNEHEIRLDYQQRGEVLRYTVRLTYTTLASGGRRPWWQCPVCGRRCGVLYSCRRGGRYFVCRICGDLAYASQHTRDRKYDDVWDMLARTKSGRALLAQVEADLARDAAEARAKVETTSLPVKRPRGRPHTKRKYTRRQQKPLE